MVYVFNLIVNHFASLQHASYLTDTDFFHVYKKYKKMIVSITFKKVTLKWQIKDKIPEKCKISNLIDKFLTKRGENVHQD